LISQGTARNACKQCSTSLTRLDKCAAAVHGN
jgi:hypothetical protein